MKGGNFVTALEFCTSHNIDLEFLYTLEENGLIELEIIEETICIHENKLPELEKIIRLHFDLEINIEGIETIIYLLGKSDEMQQEINDLRNRLRLYEDL